MSLANQKRADRFFQGLMPEFYDQVLYAYPTPTSIELTLTYVDEVSGNNIVAAIIEINYTDATQNALSSVRRLL